MTTSYAIPATNILPPIQEHTIWYQIAQAPHRHVTSPKVHGGPQDPCGEDEHHGIRSRTIGSQLASLVALPTIMDALQKTMKEVGDHVQFVSIAEKRIEIGNHSSSSSMLGIDGFIYKDI